MKLRRDLVIPAISLSCFYFPFLESQIGQFAMSIKRKICSTLFPHKDKVYQVANNLLLILKAAWIHSSSMIFWGKK